MKYVFLILLGVIILLNSCKKSDDVVNEDTTYVTFKVDGSLKNLAPCTATVKPIASGSEMTIRSQAGGYAISLQFINNYLVASNEYLPLVMEYDNANDIPNDHYLSDLFLGYPIPASDVQNATTVTSVTDKNVTGTFKFKGTNTSTSNPQVKIITEGQFSCKIIRTLF